MGLIEFQHFGHFVFSTAIGIYSEENVFEEECVVFELGPKAVELLGDCEVVPEDAIASVDATTRSGYEEVSQFFQLPVSTLSLYRNMR